MSPSNNIVCGWSKLESGWLWSGHYNYFVKRYGSGDKGKFIRAYTELKIHGEGMAYADMLF